MPKGNRPVLTTARLALRRFSGIPRRSWRPVDSVSGATIASFIAPAGTPCMGRFSADCPYSVDAHYAITALAKRDSNHKQREHLEKYALTQCNLPSGSRFFHPTTEAC